MWFIPNYSMLICGYHYYFYSMIYYMGPRRGQATGCWKSFSGQILSLPCMTVQCKHAVCASGSILLRRARMSTSSPERAGASTRAIFGAPPRAFLSWRIHETFSRLLACMCTYTRFFGIRIDIREPIQLNWNSMTSGVFEAHDHSVKWESRRCQHFPACQGQEAVLRIASSTFLSIATVKSV